MGISAREWPRSCWKSSQRSTRTAPRRSRRRSRGGGRRACRLRRPVQGGKTTALRMVAGLEPITDGFVRIGGQVVNTSAQEPRHRNGLPELRPLPAHERVQEHGLRAEAPEVRASRGSTAVRDAARVLGLEDGKRPRTPRAASASVAMGRAIVREPRAFLMDEPLSNLDEAARRDAGRDRAHPARPPGDDDLRHARPGRGDDARRPRRRHARRCPAAVRRVPQTLYDRPTNLFVAEFIGSPAMNLVGADLVRVDGGLAVDFGDHRFPGRRRPLNARPALRAEEAADPRHPSGGSRGREPRRAPGGRSRR